MAKKNKNTKKTNDSGGQNPHWPREAAREAGETDKTYKKPPEAPAEIEETTIIPLVR